MASLARENRRLHAALDAAKTLGADAIRTKNEHIQALENRVTELERQVRLDQNEIHQRDLVIASERLRRVSAQRGLVNYMREHDLADQIGYDPDQDPDVQREIAEGLIPARDSDRLLREIAQTVVAGRAAS